MSHQIKVKINFRDSSQTLESLEVVLESLYLRNISDSRIGEKTWSNT